MIARSSVVLPAPLRPISPANCPASSVRLTARRIATGPIATSRSCNSSMGTAFSGDVPPHLGIVEHPCRSAVGDHTPVVEREDAPCVMLDDLHVVLDEHHRYPIGSRGLDDRIHD